jgi:DNA (cytosine-5)-methyltransferase 1
MSISLERQEFHIQWFQAGLETLMGEMSDPYELFVTEICDDVAFNKVLEPVVVHRDPPQESSGDFFCQ